MTKLNFLLSNFQFCQYHSRTYLLFSSFVNCQIFFVNPLYQQFKQVTSEVPNIRQLIDQVKEQADQIEDSSSKQEMQILKERIRKANGTLNR